MADAEYIKGLVHRLLLALVPEKITTQQVDVWMEPRSTFYQALMTTVDGASDATVNERVERYVDDFIANQGSASAVTSKPDPRELALQVGQVIVQQVQNIVAAGASSDASAPAVSAPPGGIGVIEAPSAAPESGEFKPTPTP